MRYMTSNEIRETWLNYFKNKKHEIVESASLIPVNDKTLLWINAGVAPLKKYFDGTEKPKSKRLTNVQKCIRTNDIDNVGKTARHHTFFEMLGNFSIGDYFRKEAIEMAFEILTKDEYFGFPLEKLYITYYTKDLETRKVWENLGVDPSHIIPIDDNFWEIGEGPCGPNTEIFYDRGDLYDERGVFLISEDIENDRFIEIWNIVLSQFNAKEGLKRIEYKELPNKNIDTGAGLERFACVLQNTKTNFETDLFMPIIEKIVELSGLEYHGEMAFKVIADHIKTLVFAISDGAILSNEGRGYVLRRILRRAVKFGLKLNFTEPFLYKLVDSVIDVMSVFYKNLKDSKKIVEKIILKEEEKFLETINEGEKHFFNVIKDSKITGFDAFTLYDTYGFPIELTEEYALENNVEVDLEGFKEELLKQKNRSRNNRDEIKGMKTQNKEYLEFKDKSVFVGYELNETNSVVIKVFKEGIVLDKTPFYATSGGQVSDSGYINEYHINEVIKLPNGQFLHKLLNHTLKEKDLVSAKIDVEKRNDIRKNHSATHLLHKALKEVLGTHVVQQGSLVNEDYLRFDFNHYENITEEELLKIEKIVNEKISLNIDVVIKEMAIKDAKKLGAMALFGEKYGDIVRVVRINDSIELCGGTHVSNSSIIRKFAIVSFESIGSGIYRILASTDQKIEKEFKEITKYIKEEINEINAKLKNNLNSNIKYELRLGFDSYQDIIKAKEELLEIRKNYFIEEKKHNDSNFKEILSNASSYIKPNIEKNDYILLHNIDNKVLKQLVDVLYDKIKSELLLLVNVVDDSATLVLKTDGKINALKALKNLLGKINGSGGGKDNYAQGGTKDISNLVEHLEKFKEEFK